MQGMERDENFKDQVDQYALLNPSCRNQVKKQLSVLEEELRKDRLLWLQVRMYIHTHDLLFNRFCLTF